MKKLNEEIISEVLVEYKSCIGAILLENESTLLLMIDKRCRDINNNDGFNDEHYVEKIINIRDEIYDEVKKQRKEDPTDFEKLFQKASHCKSNDKDIYIAFCISIKHKKSINVEHIQQNQLKSYAKGRKTIRQLCFSKYVDYVL